MNLVKVLSMNAGNHQYSYAENSTIQEGVILKSKNVLEGTIMDYGTDHGFSECFKLADLGCSSGPNAFLPVTNIIKSVLAVCQEKNLKAPNEFQVLLNDLPNNDFNSLFKMTSSFYSNIEKEHGHEKSVNCFISGVPGSFYTRLFPSKSLHFVYSSFGLHWLSQIPENLLDSNRGNSSLAKSSPPCVFEAYSTQFRRDFATFLRMRSAEMIPNGRMVLTLPGRNPTSDHYNQSILLAKSLQDMLAEGLLDEKDINSFYLPIYQPCPIELEAIIESENSFSLDRLETSEVNIKSGESSGIYMAKTVRAALEPLLASHFGNAYMDKIFERFAIHATEQIAREKKTFFYIVVSLTRNCNN